VVFLSVCLSFIVINISKGEQFTSGFVAINPNSKIPALVDNEGSGDGKPLHIFESAAIDIHLCEKYHRFLPDAAVNPRARAEIMSWIMWQMGGLGPMCGQFGHFFVYAPPNQHQARDYGCARYGMEVQRLCSVLDNHLKDDNKQYLVNNEYSLADIIVFPWIYQLKTGYNHPSGIKGGDFINFSQYKYLNEWVDRINARPAVQRGLTVCSSEGGKPWLNKKEEK
jgi:GST-like protein